MINIFKQNNWFRFVLLLLVFAITRFVVFDPNFPVSLQETYFSVLGIKMNQGYLLYKDFTENIAPLSAMVYWGLEYFDHQNFLLYHIIAAGFTLYQILYFYFTFNKLNVFPEENFIPAFLFVLYSSISFEFFTLSPQLMGSTFLLFAINHTYQLILKGDKTDETYKIGLFCGIASLFYFPYLIFSFLVLLSLSLFSNVPIRKYFLLFLGVLFPLLLTWSFFMYLKAGEDFFKEGVIFSFSFNKIFYFSINDFLILFSMALLIGVLGYWGAIRTNALIYFQQRCRIIMFFWVIAGLFSELISFQITYSSLWILVLPLTYYSYFFFYETKKWWIRFSIYTLFLGSVFLGVYGFHYDIFEHDFKHEKIPTYGKILLISSKTPLFQNKDNHPIIGFVNLKLTFNLLNNLDDRKNVLKTVLLLKKELPEYIIDDQNILSKKLFISIPPLKKMYKLESKGVYKRI